MENKTQEQTILAIKEEVPEDDFQVEYEILPAYTFSEFKDIRQKEISEKISEIDAMSAELEEKIDKLNVDINRLTNHADGIDYMIAVGCGIVAGIFDSIFVGEWNFEKAKAKSNEQINKKVMDFAKKQGYEGDRLEDAINFLENKYKLPGDIEWNIKKKFVDEAKKKGFNSPPGKKGKYEDAVKFMNENFPKKDGTKWGVVDNFITDKTHHLDDFCHHPNLVGLICCIIVQFTGTSIYANKNSEIINVPVTVNDYGQLQGHNAVTRFFCGIINWFMNAAKTMANAKGHWMSDLAGSSGSAGNGMGLPGSFMSLLKELSALPIIKDIKFTNKKTGKKEIPFAEILRKAYQNGIGTGKKQVDLGIFNSLFEGASSKFDYRTENAIKLELKRQSVPVIINEILVRALYFIRRFIIEIKSHDTLKEINWKNTIPLRNRTIARMMTIASGTFTACDLADAAIRSAVKNAGVENPAFWKDFILRINFVGIGRFAIAVGTDVGMGIKRQVQIRKRMEYRNEDGILQVAKIYYLQENMWIEVEDTEEAMQDLYNEANKAFLKLADDYTNIQTDIKIFGEKANALERIRPGAKARFLERIQWGN